jgi:hypothetical protein
MATKPQPSQARPTAGTYPPPPGAAPHSAYDAMYTPPDVTGCDGGAWEDLADQ